MPLPYHFYYYLSAVNIPETYSQALHRQKSFFLSGETKNIKYRIHQLQLLQKAIQQYEKALLQALKEDLGKNPAEAYASEIGFVYTEIKAARRNLKFWARDELQPTPLLHFPTRSFIRKSPLGISLIIGPWNYPFQLLFAPLVASVAAGNVQVLKGSEFAPNTNRIIEQLLKEFFDPDYISFYQGKGHLVVPQLMNSIRFDKIFFTGSTAIGKKIAIEAAKTLTPITLELGGKSPAIVDPSADLSVSARRIVWGKYYNAGQTCVSPDYIIVHRSVAPILTDLMIQSIKAFYTDNPLRSQSLGRMIHQAHFDRMLAFLKEADILYGGKYDAEQLKIEPTLVRQKQLTQKIMQEEIFGPILPIISYNQLDEIDHIIAQNPNPLALYVFSKKKIFIQNILDKYSFGGACINNTLIHLNNPNLPFGGVGQSGSGYYHGEWGFRNFSQLKAISRTGTWLDIKLKYPPYSSKTLTLFKKLIR